MAVTGSLGTVYEKHFNARYRSYRFTWTSDGSAGSVSENPLVVAPGRLLSLKCIPSGGSTAPTVFHGGPLTPTIANAGNSKIGTLELTIVQDA